MLAFAVLALIPFVAAQDPKVEVAAIKAHFSQAGIIPGLVTTLDPSALMNVNFADVGDVKPGQPVTQEQSGKTPALSFVAADSNTKFEGKYTIFMVDADIAGTQLPAEVNRHWLVNDVSVTDNKLSLDGGKAVTDYAGPGPAEGSGPHRYTILLFQQPTDFAQPQGFTDKIGVTKMDLQKYISDAKLGNLIAANYFTVEVGTATVTPSATSAVVSSTLISASGSGSPSGSSGSPSGSGSGNGATPTSKPNGASSLTIGAGSVFAAIFAVVFLA